MQTALDEPEALHLDIGRIGESVVDRARDRVPAATIETAIADRTIVKAPPIVEEAVWKLLENACEHGGDRPHIEVAVGTANGSAELAVIDDGPGLRAQERQGLGTGRETVLEHGRGWACGWPSGRSRPQTGLSTSPSIRVRQFRLHSPSTHRRVAFKPTRPRIGPQLLDPIDPRE